MISAERQKGEEHLYREEKYAAVYEINMLRCIFCGLCEEACPKEAIYLDGPHVTADYLRKDFIYGKDKLVEPGLTIRRNMNPRRSEEHTSELQSLMRTSYAVFCLKKKKHNKHTQYQHKRR